MDGWKTLSWDQVSKWNGHVLCVFALLLWISVQTLLSLGLSYGWCLSMVHMTMRSVKPSCLSVSAQTSPAGPNQEKHHGTEHHESPTAPGWSPANAGRSPFPSPVNEEIWWLIQTTVPHLLQWWAHGWSQCWHWQPQSILTWPWSFSVTEEPCGCKGLKESVHWKHYKLKLSGSKQIMLTCLLARIITLSFSTLTYDKIN